MTKSIHFIGDAHVTSIYNAILSEDGVARKSNKNGYNLYPSENCWTAYNFNTGQEYNFHSKPGRLAYKIDYSSMKFLNNIKAGDTVIASMGECDIRLCLHKHKNTQEVVEAYVRETLAYFAENRVFFLTPVPQTSTEYTVTIDGEDFTFDADIRLAEHKNFVKYLVDICSELSLPEPIDISFGLDTLEIENRDEDGIHMSEEHSVKVLKEILKRQDLHL